LKQEVVVVIGARGIGMAIARRQGFGARVNSISPGIIATPLAQHELNSPIGDIYRAMIDASPAKRMASPDEVAVAA
jgi:NAD(P)-dependent dehydrogenase (short-subunit alcohol dehydrogenase family)